MEEDFYKKMRKECWDYSVDSIGTAFVFQEKVSALEKLSKIAKVMGVLLPVALGGIVASYSLDSVIVSWAISICAFLGVIQLVFSVGLLVSDAESNIIQFTEIATENKLLHIDFLQMAKFPPPTLEEFEKRFLVLSERKKGVSRKSNLNTKEERKGLRYGLRLHNRACVKCEIVPYDLEPTDCPVCGKF